MEYKQQWPSNDFATSPVIWRCISLKYIKNLLGNCSSYTLQLTCLIQCNWSQFKGLHCRQRIGLVTTMSDPTQRTNEEKLRLELSKLAHLNKTGLVSKEDSAMHAHGGFCDVFIGKIGRDNLDQRISVEQPGPEIKVAIKRLRRRLSNLFMIKLHRTGAPVHFAFFRSTPLLIGRFTKPPNMGLLSVTRTFQHSENSRLFNEDQSLNRY